MELFEERITSPSQIARALGEPVGVVAYHVQMLRAAGLVTLVDRRQRRGAIEHLYTARTGPTITDGEWSRLPVAERRVVIAGALRRFGPELGEATSCGGLDRDGAHVDRIRARMDGRAWLAATRELKRTLDRLERLAVDAKLRLCDLDPGRTRYGVAMLMLFKEPAGPPAEDRRASGAAPIDLADPRMVAADAHPLRAEIFRLLTERTASPSDVARQLGAPVPNASYHVRQLAGLGLVQLVERRESRGALEHYYEATVRPTIVCDWWQDRVADESASRTVRLIVNAARHGGFDHDRIHLSRTPFPIDRRSWEGFAEALAVVGRRIRGLVSAPPAAARGPRAAAAETVHAITMLFERTPARAATVGLASSAAAR
jgi:DNA-binding transcriptional ArsR family regulator